MPTRILVVDDELSMREFLSILLEREGYEVDTAGNPDEALGRMLRTAYDMVISDVQMPGLNGIELLARIKESSPDTAVLMITAFSTAEQAVEAMKLGAYDYIAKPFKIEEIKVLIKNALEKRDLKRENAILRKQVSGRDSFCGIIGKSQRIREVFSLIEKVAGTGSTVLILGESGTGKELVARAIHSSGTRKDKPFVAVNCGAIPENLMESELFGHKKGAFTGAVHDHPGLFEQAEGGTLFLDEIGELPLSLQTKLLRVLQEKEFRRVGCSKVRKSDARIISASNRNLKKFVQEGNFREDLFYRINVMQIDLPSLRERIDDIPILVEHLFRKFNPSAPIGEIITQTALKMLMNYSFPGNIRELENIVERSLILDSSRISEANLPSFILDKFQNCSASPFDVNIPPEGVALEAMLEELEKKYLVAALEKSGGVKKKAGDLLGMSFRSVRYKLSKHGLDSGD